MMPKVVCSYYLMGERKKERIYKVLLMRSPYTKAGQFPLY